VTTALSIPKSIVEPRLDELLKQFRREWSAVEPQLTETIDLLESLVLSGGKRVRPAMAYWGFVGAGGRGDDPRIADIAAALELLQAFALFHDDVMDGSPTRRGAPTAHKVAEASHIVGEWSGESRRYGESVAILAGDVALVLSDVVLADVNAEVRRLWNALRIEVNLGQFLDVTGTARGAVSLTTAERIVEFKTARYTIVRPLQMGAAAMGRTDLEDALGDIGTPLGVAFQLRDDMLGAFGETEVTGKPVGDDLRDGKPTPLLARACDAATSDQMEILNLIGPGITADQISKVQQVLVDTGAVAAIEAQINELTAVALRTIETSAITSEAQSQLTELATFLASRSS